jgi:CHAT domain-containing protein
MSIWPVRLAAFLAFSVGCSKPAQTAEEIYAKAQAAFEDENFEQALSLIPSEAVLRELRSSRTQLDRFQLLRAETLALQPESGPGMALLAIPLPAGADPELERQRRRSLGYGKCRIARTSEERRAGLAILDEVLTETPPLTAEAGKIDLRRGACLRAMGEFVKADTSLRSALMAAKASKDRLLEAKTLSSLGNISAIRERFDEAATYTKEAVRVAEQAGPVGRNVIRRAVDNLGWYQFELGDYDQALVTLAKLQPKSNRERIVNENNQARSLLALEDFAGAEAHYQKALAAAKAGTGADAGDEAGVIQGLAVLSYRRGKWFEAAHWNRSARTLIERLRRPDLERIATLMDARIRLAQGDAAGAEPLLRRLLADTGISGQVRWTAHTELARLLAGQERPAAAEAEFRRAMQGVEQAQAGLTAAQDRISFLSGRIDVYRDTLQFLLQQNRTVDALQVAERSRARTLQDKTAGGRARKGATVLFYWLDEPDSHLWVVGPAKAPVYHRLPGAKEIQDVVERHNQFLLRARNPLTEGGQEARQLFQMLVQPAVGQIGGSRVLISPDGGLHALNFETLIAPGPDHYWLEDVEISIVPSLAGRAGSARAHSNQILLAGDAVEVEPGYIRLRHAGEELDRIGEQFGTVPLKKEGATPRALRAGLEKSPAYVHFAAHAQANRLRPLESAILLSPDGGSGSGGGYKLYARDVAAIPIQARLVTLSACTAAGAKTFRGEGLVGFAWAFLGAGAENVVASLWEVDDASTPRLMAQMYRQLQLGKLPSEALREAKLALLRSGTALQKPYFWGAFLHFQH